MLQLQNISHGYSGKFLYESISYSFPKHTKLALVGINGIGKSTLFKLLCGYESPNKGSIAKATNARIEYLPQELTIENELTVLEMALSGFSDILELETNIYKLNDEIAQTTDQNTLDKKLTELSKLNDIFESKNGYFIETEAKKILSGLGFSEDQFSLKLKTFSGGWRMRALLAKMLVSSPDYLLLDEPTNHLDIDSLKWLESFLKSYPNAVVIISHDRVFLDQIISRTLELTPNGLDEYKGNYSFYEIEKEERILSLEKSNERKRKEIEHIQQFVDRFRYKASKAKQVQSRVKMLEKYSIAVQPEASKKIQLTFKVSRPSAKEVFKFEKLSKSYEKSVLNNINGTIYRGEKLAILGPNGAGKSTFVKLLLGTTNVTSGHIEIGSNVHVGYFAQHQVDELNVENTIFYEVSSAACEEKRLHVRDVLGAMLFSGDEIDKQISILSGGEKARVAMAKLLVSKVNTLILDEPTNHLDIQSKEALQMALTDFDGTILIISHDRSFLDGLVDTFYYFKNGSYQSVSGDFEDFENMIYKSESIQNTAENESDKSLQMDFKEQKRLKNQRNKIEREIKSLEEMLEQLEEKKETFTTRQFSETDPKKVIDLQEKIDALGLEILDTMEQWEEKSMELESYQ